MVITGLSNEEKMNFLGLANFKDLLLAPTYSEVREFVEQHGKQSLQSC